MDNSSETATRRSTHARDAIRAAAEILFAENGYGATGIRDIAAQAGVNSALVIRHFGSKESLFLQTMQVADTFSAVIYGPIQSLGVRTVAFLLSPEADAEVRGVFTALLRASDRAGVQDQLRAALELTVIQPIADQLGTPDAALRGWMFAAQMAGLMSSLWLLSERVPVDVPDAVLIERYGALLQAAVTGPAGGPA